jgi:hypothetical protein
MSAFAYPGMVAVALIAQLGSPQYRDREKAGHNLSRLSPLAVPYLQSAQSHKNPEIAIRSTILLTSFYRSNAEKLTAQALPADWPHLPWIDMLPADYPCRDSIVSHYLNQAQNKFGRGNSPQWQDYRMATQIYIHQMFVNGASPKTVQCLLDQMAEAERQWIITNGKRYNPPLELPTVAAKAP